MASQSATTWCQCRWKLGENTSGDCTFCNEVIIALSSRRRGRNHVYVSPDDDDFAPKQPAARRATNPVVSQQKPQEPPSAPVSIIPSSIVRVPDAAANVLLRAFGSKEADQAKIKVDENLARSGWARCKTREAGGIKQNNLQHKDFEVVFCDRDGHCLVHCLLGILKDRYPQSDEVPKSVKDLREAIASYQETNVDVDGDSTIVLNDVPWKSENIQAFRTGKDTDPPTYVSYGGLPEIVAFAFKYNIAVTVHAPESLREPFEVPGWGAPEHLLQTWGWSPDGRKKRPGLDHWQRLNVTHYPVPLEDAFAVHDICIVRINGTDTRARVVFRKCVRLGNTDAGDDVAVCSWYRCDNLDGQALGQFAAGETSHDFTDVLVEHGKGEERIEVESGSEGMEAGGGEGED